MSVSKSAKMCTFGTVLYLIQRVMVSA